MNPVRSWRGLRLGGRVDAYADLLAAGHSADIRARMQLDRLNRSWAGSLRRSPFARAMRDIYDLPDSFESWAAFQTRVPVIDKSALRRIVAMSGAAVPGERVVWRATGGTTAEPFRFPVFADEAGATTVPMWHARRAFGVG